MEKKYLVTFIKKLYFSEEWSICLCNKSIKYSVTFLDAYWFTDPETGGVPLRFLHVGCCIHCFLLKQKILIAPTIVNMPFPV